MENLNETKKSFWKDKKNIAIIVLSFLVLCFLVAFADSDSYKNNEQTAELENQINTLTTENENLNKKIEENNNQITELQDTNKSLEEENSNLKSQVEELQKTASSGTSNTSNTSSTTATPNTSSNTSTTASSTPSTTSSNSSNATTAQKTNTSTNTDTDSEMVWVGETGTKYHIQSCRTLKGKGHQITLKQALAEGREPCKVCH